MTAWGWGCVPSARRWGKGLPWRRRIAGLRGGPATGALRHGSHSYGRQQLGIFPNGRKPEGATPREGRRSSDRKPLNPRRKAPTRGDDGSGGIAPANSVPAAAVIRRVQALPGITGRKGRVGGPISPTLKTEAQPRAWVGDCGTRPLEREPEFLVERWNA